MGIEHRKPTIGNSRRRLANFICGTLCESVAALQDGSAAEFTYTRRMAVVDWILNLAGVLLWSSWRSNRVERAASRPNVGLASTLRKAESRGTPRWSHFLLLLALLLLRSLFYWQVGSQSGLSLELDLIAITLPFRCDRFLSMLLYSSLSFLLALGVFFSWLVLISSINRKVSDSEPVQRMIRSQLGLTERLPVLLRLMMPGLIAVLGWAMISTILARLEVIPAHATTRLLWEQAALFGWTTILLWKFPVVILLLVHLFTSYVYVGAGTLLSFITATSRNLLRLPGRLQIRFGKLDLSPIVWILLIVVLSAVAEDFLPRVYQWLPP